MESVASNQINNDYTELFFYATMCHVCKRFGDGVHLKSCGGCKMIAYCGQEHQKQHWKQHKSLCKAIQVVLRDDSMDYRGETTEKWADKKLSFMQLVSSRLGRDLNVTDSEMVYNIWAANSSEYLTRPLTMFYAVGLLNYVLEGTFLIIHLVGANYLEEATLWTWEIFLQLMETVTSIMIVMIWPGLKDKLDPSRTDDNFFVGNKSLFSEYHDVSYEDYVDSSKFIKPDLIVGFNPSIQEHELNNKEIWAPSIRALAKQNCPFILTFSKLRELEEGMNKMNTILGKELDYFGSGRNPFASCKPHRDFGSERVCYHNQYIIIYQSLCS
ncbi:putative protein MSS51 homolog, mitochondrial [Temnothorax nylanderi]|uniref:putative protein MSS51 homolog, mitochondrial n=1 Tax=Temnothorax nylanderi TaxID=102681 RepID=UPI003A8ABAA2